MKEIYTILVVDDEPDNFDVIEAFLNDRNYHLHYAACGQQAIHFLDTYNPDLILLDVMMPGINGMEVCQQIKHLPKWQMIPIVMVTALATKSHLAQCLAAGADDFISKPVNPLELRARVQSMLRIKEQFDRIQSLSQTQENTIRVLRSTLDELQGSLASRLSHELNTPLNGIVGAVEILKDNLENMDIAEVREIITWIDASANRLDTLTQKLLLYLELELEVPGVPTPLPQKLPLLSIEEALKSCALSQNRLQDLHLSLAEVETTLSEHSLKTILYELVENALKFSELGTPVLVQSTVEEHFLQLFVSNQGRGLTAEQIARIDAFMQFDRKHYQQQGIGLGLKIVQKIVALCQGKLTINSREGETQFQVTLPLMLPSKP